jgi:hypothetical protein
LKRKRAQKILLVRSLGKGGEEDVTIGDMNFSDGGVDDVKSPEVSPVRSV